MHQAGDRMVTDIVFTVFKHQAAGLGTALGAATQRLLRAEIGELAGLLPRFVVAEVKFKFEVFAVFIKLEHDLGSERPTRFGAKAIERTDFFLAHELLYFGQFKSAACRCFAEGKTAALFATGLAGAGVAAVVFFHDAAAIGTGALQGGVVAGDGVAVVLFGFFHHALGHGGDFGHKGLTPHLALLHQRQFVFPFTGQFGLGQLFHTQAAQERHQLKGLGRRNQLAALAQHVFFVEQTFNNGRARRGCAQTFFAHGFAELFVFYGFARAFHSA